MFNSLPEFNTLKLNKLKQENYENKLIIMGSARNIFILIKLFLFYEKTKDSDSDRLCKVLLKLSPKSYMKILRSVGPEYHLVANKNIVWYSFPRFL